MMQKLTTLQVILFTAREIESIVLDCCCMLAVVTFSAHGAGIWLVRLTGSASSRQWVWHGNASDAVLFQPLAMRCCI